VLFVVLAVDAEYVLEVASAENQYPVEAVDANRANPALGVGIRVRRLDRRTDHSDVFGPEGLIEGVAELRVAVVDEEPERLLPAQLHDEVASLLGDPVAVRVRRASDVLDPPRRERDEEQDVDPLQERCLDGQEVAGEHARRLCSHERSPGRVASLRRRQQTRCKQYLADRRRRDGDPDALELADDPPVSPVRVLVGEPQDQRSQRRLERRPPGLPVRITSNGEQRVGSASATASPA
jgi:hypothetical protein